LEPQVEAVQDQLPHPSGWSLARATAFCGPQFLACMASPNCHLVGLGSWDLEMAGGGGVFFFLVEK